MCACEVLVCLASIVRVLESASIMVMSIWSTVSVIDPSPSICHHDRVLGLEAATTAVVCMTHHHHQTFSSMRVRVRVCAVEHHSTKCKPH